MNAPRRALIVIDVQNEYFTGRLRIEHPDPQRSLANVVAAMQAARGAGIPVVVVQNVAPASSPLFARGSDGWQLHPRIAAQPRDLLVEKTLPDVFSGTPLADWLRERDIATLAIAGYMTHNCDASSAMVALHLGFAVEFLTDAAGSVPYLNVAGHASAEEIHRVFSVVLHSRFGWTGPTADWIAAIREGRALQRGNIRDSHQAALAARREAAALVLA